MDANALWPDARDFLRLLVVAPLAYAALIATLRVSGKRMLSKMSAFDFVVTVALGSTLATILLSKQVALAEGVFALVLLIALQYLVAWSISRSQRIRRIAESEPTLLLFRGRFLTEALHDENVSEDEVRSAIRSEGFATLEEVEAVVLEANGSLSVIRRLSDLGTSTLGGIRNPPSQTEAGRAHLVSLSQTGDAPRMLQPAKMIRGVSPAHPGPPSLGWNGRAPI